MTKPEGFEMIVRLPNLCPTGESEIVEKGLVVKLGKSSSFIAIDVSGLGPGNVDGLGCLK